MNKRLGIVVLSILFCQSANAVMTKLKCKDIIMGIAFDDYIYINFDEKIIEVIQAAGGNKIEFFVKKIDEYVVESWERPLLKGAKYKLRGKYESYDTYITDWLEWWDPNFKNHLWLVKIDRLQGYAGIAVTKEPMTENRTTYNLEETHTMECKKRGTSKF